MRKTLLVLAAGMGSRYGGLKQMEGFGPSGETILEYSIFDARRAGFNHFVFVIRKRIEAEFRAQILSRLPEDLEFDLCFQELDILPSGFVTPKGREKPWGTGHAVWVARDLIDGPFAIVNGDDFYGRNGFAQLSEFFDRTGGDRHAMVGYPLGRTLSGSGAVSRGICGVGVGGELLAMREVIGIRRQGESIIADSDSPVALNNDTMASMNLFGFGSGIFARIDRDFLTFLRERGAELKSEFYIPTVVNNLLDSDRGSDRENIQVLGSKDDWMGVTNPNDRPEVVEGIQQLVLAGVYPQSLWSDN